MAFYSNSVHYGVCFSMGYLVKFPWEEIRVGIGASSDVLFRDKARNVPF